MPEDGKSILNFTSYHKQLRVPYIIYANFECLNISVEGGPAHPENGCAHQISKQVPYSYCYVRVRSDGQAKDPVLYCGENAVEHLLDSLHTELEKGKRGLR